MDDAPGSYFEHVAAWLAKQPQRTAAAAAKGGVRPPRVVTEPLANLTLNRIRRLSHPSSVWQTPRWRTRHKRTGAMRTIDPVHHDDGIFGLLEPNTRLVLAHTHGDRLRLRATLAFLNARVDHQLSPHCYGGRPRATANGTDRRAALRRFRRLVWEEGNRWVAKLDVRQFFDTLPHGPMLEALREYVADRGCVREVEGYLAWYWKQCWPGHATVPPDPVGTPQGSPISGVLANVYLASFDKSLAAAGIQFIRYLDDVSVVARDRETLVRHLAAAMAGLERLGLALEPEKTKVAFLDTTPPPVGSIELPAARGRARVDREFDLLGIHFHADGTFRARERTVNRLLSKVRRIIRRRQRSQSPHEKRERQEKHPIRRYIEATWSINRLLGYEIARRRPGSAAKPPAAGVRLASRRGPRPASAKRCWIARVRYVQPRQHAVLGHSDLILAQMQRVDRLIRRWMKREFGRALARTSPRKRAALEARRVRSAARMFQMAVREPGH